MMRTTIRSNSLYIPLRDESVHCVITSPPYWGLRDYGVEGQLGLEKTPEEYVQNMVKVFREVKRILRDDGTCWVNMGDCFTHNRFSSPMKGNYQGDDGLYQRRADPVGLQAKRTGGTWGLKVKDLVGMPWRLAFALQADGWYLRSDIIWAKNNPMPESVTDRPTKAHEYVFLLTKSPHYFFDQEAVRENDKGTDHWRAVTDGQKSLEPSGGLRGPHQGIRTTHGRNGTGRNIRSVWNIATQPFSGAHFATFPEELVRRCLFAGTSEKGCCPKCGGPWVRVVEKGELVGKNRKGNYSGRENEVDISGQNRMSGCDYKPGMSFETKTLGWRPSCKCIDIHHPVMGAPNLPIPCTVFDPFFGAGTVGVVAQKYNRRFIGLELKPEYCQMAQNRLNSQPVAMI